jgi:hypothetical protein
MFFESGGVGGGREGKRVLLLLLMMCALRCVRCAALRCAALLRSASSTQRRGKRLCCVSRLFAAL